jgi:cytochrome P450
MTVDIELIQDELINILIAGRDTTTACATFAIYLLSQHPDVLKRLSEEVQSILGAASDADVPYDESPSQPPTASPTLDNLRQMPYLRAVINETLRLFPSVPFNMRDNIAERVWVGGDGTRWYLPAGTRCVLSLLFHFSLTF